MMGVEGTGGGTEVGRSGVHWDGRWVGWTSAWKGGRFLGSSFSEEKLSHLLSHGEEEGKRLGTG